MADTVGSLRAVFTVDKSALTSGLKTAAKELSAFQKRYGDATDVELGVQYKAFMKDLKSAGRAVSNTRKDLARGVSTEVRVEGVKEATQDLGKVSREVKDTDGQKATVSVNEKGSAGVRDALGDVKKAANATNGQKATVSVGEDGSKKVLDTLGDVKRAANTLSGQKAVVGVDERGSAATTSALKEVVREANAANGQDVRINVGERGAATTAAALAGVKHEANAVNGQDVNIDVDTSAVSKLNSVGDSVKGLSSNIRSFSTVATASIGVPALVAGIGGLVPVALAASGQILRLGAAIGQGLVGASAAGVGALGSLYGAIGLLAAPISMTLSKLKAYDQSLDTVKAAQQAASSASSAYANAQRQVATAQENVGRVEEATGQQISDAQRGVQDARYQLKTATLDLANAQKELNFAEQDEPLNQAEATLNLAEARDAASDAQRDYNDAVKEYGRNSEEASDALRAQQSAQLNLQRTELDTQRTRKNGSEELQSAQEAVKGAYKSQSDAAQGVQDAEKNLQRTRADAAQQVQDAQKQVADAQRAAMEAAKAATQAQQELREATVKLTPAQKALYNEYKRFAKLADQAFLPAQNTISRLGVSILKFTEGYLPRLGVASNRTALAVTASFGDIRQEIEKPVEQAGINRFLDQIPAVTREAATAAGKLGLALFNVFTKTLPYGQKLVHSIGNLTDSFLAFTQSTKGAQAISHSLADAWRQTERLWQAMKNLGATVINVFKGLGAGGAFTDAMKGFVRFTAALRDMSAHTSKISGFMDHASPALHQIAMFGADAGRQILILGNNLVRAGQQHGSMGTLAKVIKSLRDSLVPLRKMFENAFKSLGPALAKLIPEVAKFAQFFVGSTGPLLFFVRSLTGLLHVFNQLPAGVKTTIINLVALKTLMGSMGTTALLGSWLDMRKANAALGATLGRTLTPMEKLKYSFLGTKPAAESAAAGTAVAGSRFGRLGGAVKGAIAGLGAFAVAAGPVLLVIAAVAAAAYVVYRNWDRITKVLRPATKGFQAFAQAIRPLVGGVLRAMGSALGAVAHGLLSAVIPGKKLGTQVRTLGGFFGNLAKKAIPPVSHALMGLTNFINSHQGVFRVLGKIVGTLLVSGFKVWWIVIRTGYKIIATLVRWIGRLVNFLRDVDQTTGKVSASMRKGFLGALSAMIKGVKNFGRNLLNLWRNKIWQPVASFLSQRAKGMLQTLSNWKNSTVKWVKSLVGAVVNFWKNKVWQPIATFLVQRAKNMLQTLSNWKNGAVKWVKSLVGAIYNFWKSKVWQPIANFLVDRSKGMLGTLSNWKSKAVSWVKSLPGAIGKLWNQFWDKAANKVISIKEGILQTMGNLVSGIKNAWNGLVNFIDSVLKHLGLKSDSSVPAPSSGGGGSSGGGSSGSSSTRAPGGIAGRARGGIDSGTYADTRGRTPVAWMARGGQKPRGGVADRGPRVVYGENGPESYVTLGRYTEESAKALKVANETWAKRGWLDRMDRATGVNRAHRAEPSSMGTPAGASANLANVQRVKKGYDASGATSHDWVGWVADHAYEVQRKFAPNVSVNTYANHGTGDHWGEQHSVDHWGPGGRGAHINTDVGNKVVDYVTSNWADQIRYYIWQGMIHGWGKSKPYSDKGDQHFDHVHVTYDETGGGLGGGALASVPNPKQILFDKLWGATIGPWGKHFAESMSHGFLMRKAAGLETVNAVDAIHDWIDEKIPDTIGGTGSVGDSPKGLTLDEVVTQGGWPSDKHKTAVGIAWAESGAIANNGNGTYEGLFAMGKPAMNEVGMSFSRVHEPVYNSTAAAKLQQKLGWNPWTTYPPSSGDMAHGNTKVTGYGRGGITGRDGSSIPSRTAHAFQLVADALKRFIGGPRGVAGGNGGVATRATPIVGERGAEAVVPLTHRTSEGMHALRTANRVHGGAARPRPNPPWLDRAADEGFVGSDEVNRKQWLWLRRHGWKPGAGSSGATPARLYAPNRGVAHAGRHHKVHSANWLPYRLTDHVGAHGMAFGGADRPPHHANRPAHHGARHPGSSAGRPGGDRRRRPEETLDDIKQILERLEQYGFDLKNPDHFAEAMERWQGSPGGGRSWGRQFEKKVRKEIKKAGSR